MPGPLATLSARLRLASENPSKSLDGQVGRRGSPAYHHTTDHRFLSTTSDFRPLSRPHELVDVARPPRLVQQQRLHLVGLQGGRQCQLRGRANGLPLALWRVLR